MVDRDKICSRQESCQSCPLSFKRTGNDCRRLTMEELRRYGGISMQINGKWYEPSELQAYVNELKSKIAELEDENKILHETIARHQEDEYD